MIKISVQTMSVQTKGQTWEDDETVCMLTLWAEPEVQDELKKKVRNKRVEVRKCKGQQHEDKSRNW